MYLLGSAVSMALENLPTSSGSLLPCCCLATASLIVVEFAWCGRQSGAGPCFVALCATALASAPSVKSLSAGIHTRLTEFPLCFSSFADW